MGNRSNQPMSFFGGDPNKSHFTVSVRYRIPNEDRNQERVRRRSQQDQLKALGFREQYFQYRNDDEAGKAAAKAKAEAVRAHWESQVGFPLEVVEGCFL